MANPWLRLWVDMPNDPKWRTIARVSKQSISAVIAVYIHMLTCAANATERGRTQGWNDEDIATALDMDESSIADIRIAMQGRVLDGDYLTGWEKRQPAREDGAAERAKAWREAQKAEKTNAIAQEQTQPNATERNRTLDKIRAPLVSAQIHHENGGRGYDKEAMDSAIGKVVVEFKNAPQGIRVAAKSDKGSDMPVKIDYAMPTLSAG